MRCDAVCSDQQIAREPRWRGDADELSPELYIEPVFTFLVISNRHQSRSNMLCHFVARDKRVRYVRMTLADAGVK